MTNNEIAKDFFKGKFLARTDANIAALLWYLQIALNTLEKYKRIKYTGDGVATQSKRIQQILDQLAKWGIKVTK